MDKPMTIQQVIEYYNGMNREPEEQGEFEQLVRDNQRVTEKERELGMKVIVKYESAIRILKQAEQHGDLWRAGKRYAKGTPEYASEVTRLKNIIDFIESLEV